MFLQRDQHVQRPWGGKGGDQCGWNSGELDRWVAVKVGRVPWEHWGAPEAFCVRELVMIGASKRFFISRHTH